MPRMDGREFLKVLRADENLKRLPVIVFSTSTAADDMARAYELGANCYLSKPIDLDRSWR